MLDIVSETKHTDFHRVPVNFDTLTSDGGRDAPMLLQQRLLNVCSTNHYSNTPLATASFMSSFFF